MIIILKYILTIAFVFAGGAKVFKAKPMVEQFREFGLPVLAVVVVGVLEVLGAIALWLPGLTVFAAVGLFLIMLGAVANHLKVKHAFKMYAPSLILGLLILAFVILIIR